MYITRLYLGNPLAVVDTLSHRYHTRYEELVEEDHKDFPSDGSNHRVVGSRDSEDGDKY